MRKSRTRSALVDDIHAKARLQDMVEQLITSSLAARLPGELHRQFTALLSVPAVRAALRDVLRSTEPKTFTVADQSSAIH